VVSSPLVAESNAVAETGARSGEIVAVCGVLSRADFTCQEGVVDLDIAVELASPIDPGWQKLFGHLKEAILPAQLPADTVLIRLPIPMEIRWRSQPCERRKDLNFDARKLSFEEVAIATHTMSHQRLLEGLKSRPKWLQSPASNAGESYGRRGSFACMSTGIGTRYYQELVGLSGA